MDNLIDELVRAARRCQRAANIFDRDPVDGMRQQLLEACARVGQAWCGSWFGYHATIYIQGLRPRRPGEHFDAEWGGVGAHCSRTVGPWAEYAFEAVRAEIMRFAGVASFNSINEAVEAAADAFESAREDVLPTLDAYLSVNEDAVLRGHRDTIANMRDHLSAEDYARSQAPSGQFFSRDVMALQQGLRVPHHLQFEALLMERLSWGAQAGEMARVITQATKYLQQKSQLKGKTVAKKDGTVFIGHGGSSAWRDLKEFLSERLGLQVDEFNREPTAGVTTKERLEAMLDKAVFAFLVMTAEDDHADGTRRARANVIHEVGLFQGRLGFERAIILLEDGCAEFSNITGLTQIRFPKSNIMAKSEEIRRVLEREKIL